MPKKRGKKKNANKPPDPPGNQDRAGPWPDSAAGAASRTLHRQIMVGASLEYQGPLPPGEEYAKYEEAYPGSAERILAMAEREQARRHSMIDEAIGIDKRGAAHTSIRGYIGQVFGLIAVLSGFGVAALSLSLGYPWPAVWIAGVDLGAIATVFVTGRLSLALAGPSPPQQPDAPQAGT